VNTNNKTQTVLKDREYTFMIRKNGELGLYNSDDINNIYTGYLKFHKRDSTVFDIQKKYKILYETSTTIKLNYVFPGDDNLQFIH